MYKITIVCVVVNLILVVSCLETSEQDTTEKIGSVSIVDKTSSYLTKLMLYQSKDAMIYIKNLLKDSKNLTDAIKKGCDITQGALTFFLSKSIKSLMTMFTVKYKEALSEIRIPFISDINGTSDKFIISEFKLKNIILKGLETMSLNKYNQNLCKLHSEVEIHLPKLEMRATYILNGSIEGSPIFGAGDLQLIADSMTFYEKSDMNLDCALAIFSENRCKHVNANITVNIGVKQVTMNLSDVKYKDLTESQINEQLNKILNDYIESNKTEWKQKIAEMIMNYKNNNLTDLSLINKIIKIKEDLKKMSAILNAQQKLRVPLTMEPPFMDCIATYL